MVQAGSNTATGLPVVSAIDATPGQMALQRKLRHLEVPVSSSTVSRRSINSGLGRPNCAEPLRPGPSWRQPTARARREALQGIGRDR